MNERLAVVHDLLDEIEGFIPKINLKAIEVSNWSIGQQIEHVLKATSVFAILILRHRPSDGTGAQHHLTQRLLQRGSFPRGLVQAPEVTLPASDPSEKGLTILLRKCRNRISRLSEVNIDSVAEHPYLGEMQRDEVIDFLSIHLKHHLSIMRDIVKATE